MKRNYFNFNDLSRHGYYWAPYGALTNAFNYISDSYAAWSLRKLSTTYTGSAIDIRRDDNVTSSIGFTAAGDLDTTTLLTFAGTSSVFVPRVYDQSGNGLHKIQPTASSQPTIVLSGSINYLPSSNKPCLIYDGTDDWMYSMFNDNIVSGSNFVVNTVISARLDAVQDNSNHYPWSIRRVNATNLTGSTNNFNKGGGTGLLSEEFFPYVIDSATTSSRVASNVYRRDAEQIVVETDIFDSNGILARQNSINVPLNMISNVNLNPTTSLNNNFLIATSRQFMDGAVVNNNNSQEFAPIRMFEQIIYNVPKRNDINVIETNQLSYYNILNKLYLLNNIPSASIALSLNKLNPVYTGSVLNVRRSSDNNSQDIGFDQFGVIDTDSLLSFVGQTTSSFGFVTTWYDQSGRGINLIQPTASRQPLIVNSGSVLTNAGNYYVGFDGVDDYLMQATGTNTGISSSLTSILNHKIDYAISSSNMTVRLLSFSGSNYNNYVSNTITAPVLVIDNTTNIPTDQVQVTPNTDPYNWKYLVTIKSGSLSSQLDSIIVNNVTGGFVIGSIFTGTINNLLIGCNASLAQNSKLDVRDYILYDRPLSYAQTKIIYNYLESNYKPVIDIYQTPTAAFSLRRLYNGYTGSLINVRRVDNATSSIGFDIYGNLDTSTLLTFVGTSTSSFGFVDTWYDQSGNNLHFIQPTASRQPMIVRSGSVETFSILNSSNVKTYNTFKPGMRFDANLISLMYVPNTMSFSYIHNSNSSIYVSYQPNVTESISNRRMNIIDSVTGSFSGSLQSFSDARGIQFWWDDRPQFGSGSSMTINVNGNTDFSGQRPIIATTGSRLPVSTSITGSFSSVYIPFKVGYNQSLMWRLSPQLTASAGQPIPERTSLYVDNISYENINQLTVSGSAYTASVAMNPMTLGGNLNNSFAQVDGYIDEVIFYPYNMSSSNEFMNYINKYRQNY